MLSAPLVMTYMRAWSDVLSEGVRKEDNNEYAKLPRV